MNCKLYQQVVKEKTDSTSASPSSQILNKKFSNSNIGQIVDVEEGEARLLLYTLYNLFDFYLVQPAEEERKRNALEEKMNEYGKFRLKQGLNQVI
jgi:hypothetical protein